MLEVKGVSVSYGKSRIVNKVSFAVDSTEKLAILGRNGVGKTTLLKSLIGLLPLQSGAVCLDKVDLTAMKAYERAQSGIAYVPQGREIIPNLTVKENLELGALSHTKDIKPRLEEVFEYFPILPEHLDRKGGVLSGGQQQQLAIARALMSHPKALLLDEPTEGIQPNVVAEIGNILKRIHKAMRIPIVIVEQNLKFARRLADRFLIIQKGEIVTAGAMENLSDEVIHRFLTV